jgi:protein-disulfide isomerase
MTVNAMRLIDKIRRRPALAALALAMTLSFAAAPLLAQKTAGPGGDPFKDTSIVKPPAGAKVAIVEFEDMECPACAHAFPTVHKAIEHYKIPLVRYDFPLGPIHPWSFAAAVNARYLQDKVSPKVADDYRGAVFAAQTGIASMDDLQIFTRQFFQSHGLQMPFVIDPSGDLAKEVRADHALGEKLGLRETPTIFVCTQHEWVHVTDVSLLYQTIDELEAQAGASAPPRRASH